jgi:hypothetical protein
MCSVTHEPQTYTGQIKGLTAKLTNFRKSLFTSNKNFTKKFFAKVRVWGLFSLIPEDNGILDFFP